ncbi:MAG: hypothetical protein HRT77_04855 [Halioglobus sp.]|nr:hypothetical protein [Halioglobus sp.]
MDTEKHKIRFDRKEYDRFQQALKANLQNLVLQLSQRGFGAGPGSLPADLEMHIVDAAG